MSNGHSLPDDLISAYRDGELSAAEREAAARLLEDSADARTELEDYRALSDLLRSMPADKAPGGFRASVMQRLERESLLTPSAPENPARRGLTRRFWIIGTGLAASAAGLLMVVNAGRDRLPAVGGGALVTNTGPPAPRGAATRSADPVDGFRAGARPLPETENFGVVDSPAVVASEGASRGFGGGLGRPPAGALPGDTYSYADVGADGEVMIVEVTVVDLDLGMNQLRYLLAKNSIEPQPVATHDYDRLSIVADPNGSDLGVYVVSDPAQINAALEEARRQSDLFLDFKVNGVLNAPSSEPAGDGAIGEALDEVAPEAAIAPEQPEIARRGMGAAAETDLKDLPEREAEVVGRARASYPSERFVRETVSPTADARREFAVEAPRPYAPPVPAPAGLEAPKLAEARDREESFGFQQLLNVSKAEISLQLRREQDKLAKQEALSAGVAGTAEPATEFFQELPAPTQLPFGDATDRARELRQQADRPMPAPQAQRRLRMLVLLEPDASALKAKAGPAPTPVEATRPPAGKG